MKYFIIALILASPAVHADGMTEMEIQDRVNEDINIFHTDPNQDTQIQYLKMNEANEVRDLKIQQEADEQMEIYHSFYPNH